MGEPEFRRQNHFVPSVYLKQWASVGDELWIYRLLVSHPNVPLWQKRTLSGVAYHAHLYTDLALGVENDEVERWLDREFEAPAAGSIQRAVGDRRLTPDDWRTLARFVAAQDVRTPARLLEFMKRWESTLPEMLDTSLQEAVARLEELRASAQPVPVVDNKQVYSPTRVSVEMPDGVEDGFVKAEILAGRGLWISSIKHLLTHTAKALLKHRWTILRPPEGIAWITSDDPVVRLNYYRRGVYDFRGGWGSPGTEIFLPLSPQHLLYTKMGEKPAPRGTVLDRVQAQEFTRLIAEHAHRMIFAQTPNAIISRIRSRYVDAEAFDEERRHWNEWHERQSAAEISMVAPAISGDRGA